MERKIFFERIRDDYFSKLECNFEGLKEMISGAMPVFGVLETDIIPLKDRKMIVFRDIHHAMFSIAPEGYVVIEGDTDMSGTILTLTLDKDNIITLAEHGIRMFTPANKETVLLLGGMIGKKITFG